MSRFGRFSKLIVFAALAAMAGGTLAQSADRYPAKPVRWIVPFLAGSSSDAVARMFGDRFAKDLGQPTVIDNRGGANGIIGATAAAQAAPDGYTLSVNTGMYVVNHWLLPDLPFDSLRDLTPVSMLARGDWMLAVHPSLPADNLKDFVSYAKANPEKINVSTVGSIGQLMYLMMMNATGTKLTLVKYKGGPQPLADLVAGRIEGILTGVANLSPLVRSGKLKGIAVAGARRNPALPNLPTFSEAGLKDFDPHAWWALIAPGKTPRDIIQKLNAEVHKAQETPEVVDALAKQLNAVYPTTVVQAEQFVRTEAERLGKLIKEYGLKPEDE